MGAIGARTQTTEGERELELTPTFLPSLLPAAGSEFAAALMRAKKGETGVVIPTFVESPLFASEGVTFFSSNVELGVSPSLPSFLLKPLFPLSLSFPSLLLLHPSYPLSTLQTRKRQKLTLFPPFVPSFPSPLQPEGVAKIHPLGELSPEEQEYLKACLPDLKKNIEKGSV